MLKYKMEIITSFFTRSAVKKLITSEEVSEELTRETVSEAGFVPDSARVGMHR